MALPTTRMPTPTTAGADDGNHSRPRALGTGGDAVADETVDLTYNAAGQVQTIDRYEGGQLAVEADYTYDSAGRLESLVYHQGTTVLASYTYSYAASAAAGGTPDSASDLLAVAARRRDAARRQHARDRHGRARPGDLARAARRRRHVAGRLGGLFL